MDKQSNFDIACNNIIDTYQNTRLTKKAQINLKKALYEIIKEYSEEEGIVKAIIDIVPASSKLSLLSKFRYYFLCFFNPRAVSKIRNSMVIAMKFIKTKNQDNCEQEVI